MPGWEIPKEAEIGKGAFYNSGWGNKFVVELDGNQNNVIRQKLILGGQKYTLEIDYAARSGYVESSEMSISWNGKQVAYVKGQDVLVHTLRV